MYTIWPRNLIMNWIYLIYSRKITASVWKDVCTWTFSTATYIIAKYCKIPKCLLISKISMLQSYHEITCKH